MKLTQHSSGLSFSLSRHQQAIKVKTIHSIKRFNHLSIRTSAAWLTFFFFLSVLAFVVHRVTFGSVSHPLLSAAVETVLLEVLELKVFVALVERDQKQFFALSPPKESKREDSLKSLMCEPHKTLEKTWKRLGNWDKLGELYERNWKRLNVIALHPCGR